MDIPINAVRDYLNAHPDILEHVPKARAAQRMQAVAHCGNHLVGLAVLAADGQVREPHAEDPVLGRKAPLLEQVSPAP